MSDKLEKEKIAAEKILELIKDHETDIEKEILDIMISDGQVLLKRAENLIKNSQEDKHYDPARNGSSTA